MKLLNGLIQLHDNVYYEDFCEFWTKAKTRKQKIQLLKEIEAVPGVKDIVLFSQCKLELPDIPVLPFIDGYAYCDFSNETGYTLLRLQNELKNIKKHTSNPQAFYDFLGSISPDEYKLVIRILQDKKPVKIKGLTPKLLVDAGYLGNEN